METIKIFFTGLAKTIGLIIGTCVFIGVMAGIGKYAASFEPDPEPVKHEINNTASQCKSAYKLAGEAYDDSNAKKDIKTIIQNLQNKGLDGDTASAIATSVDSHYARAGSKVGAMNKVSRSCTNQKVKFDISEK